MTEMGKRDEVLQALPVYRALRFYRCMKADQRSCRTSKRLREGPKERGGSSARSRRAAMSPHGKASNFCHQLAPMDCTLFNTMPG